MIPLLQMLFVSALAATAVALLTPLVRAVALRRGQVTEAREDRWHTRPTPAVGGVAIVAGFAIAILAEIILTGGRESFDLWQAPQAVIPLSPRRGLLLGVLLVSVVGFVDDIVQLRPGAKLMGQVAAAAILVASGIGVWLTGVYLVDVLISLFWFVGITNAMNLLDNMDGLAGGIGAIAAIFIGINILLESGPTPMAGVAFAFSGALIGFLVHNYPPARIFMGDSGSLFVGLSLAGLALAPAPGGSRSLFAVIAVPVVVLAIPILDTTFVTVTRLFERRSIAQGGRDHTSHGLVAMGVSEERAVWILWSLALMGGVVGLVLRESSRTFAYLLGGGLVVMLALLGAFLLVSRMRHLERAEEAEQTQAFLRFREMHERFPVLAMLLDMVLIGLAYWGAYVVRWDEARLPAELEYFQATLIVVIAAKAAAFIVANAYNSRWSHFGVAEVIVVARANLLASGFMLALLYLWEPVGLSRGVMVVDALLCLALTTAWRASFQLMQQTQERWSVTGIPVVIVGGSRDADLVLHSMRREMEPKLRLVCIVDPEPRPVGTRFRGYRVYSGPEGLASAVARHGVTGAVLVRFGGVGGAGEALVDAYLHSEGSLDVVTLDVALNRRGAHEVHSD